MRRGQLASDLSYEPRGRAVVVREVPGREPGVVIGEHLGARARGLDVAVRAGDLPHAVEDTADAEIGGELEAARSGYCHFHLAVLCRILALETLAAKFAAGPVRHDSVLRSHHLKRHARVEAHEKRRIGI